MANASREVTDPYLLQQLNAGQAQQPPASGSGNEVTDPYLLAQLNGQQQPQQQLPASSSNGLKGIFGGISPAQAQQAQGQLRSNTFDTAMGRAPIDVLGGLAQMGHSLINAPHNIANAISPSLGAKVLPGMNPYDYRAALASKLGFPAPTMGDRIATSMGENAPSIAMPGMRLGQAGDAISKIPAIGDYLANVLSRAPQQAAFGALTSQNPVKGAEQYGGMQAAVDALPLPFKALGNAISAIRPQETVNKIMDSIGNGQSLKDNAKMLASSIRSAYQTAKGYGSGLYNNIFDTFNSGDRTIQAFTKKEKIPATVSSTIVDKSGNPFSVPNQDATRTVTKSPIPDSVSNKFSAGTRSIYNTFLNNPTVENAHKLQSQLGFDMRSVKNPDIADTQTLSNYQKAQSDLQHGIKSELTNAEMENGVSRPTLANQYDRASENWSANVIPYKNPKIVKIAEGKTKAPGNITTIFKEPENNDDINTILGHLPNDARNRVLYAELGKINPRATPEKLMKAAEGLGNKGLTDYASPGFQNDIGELSNKMRNRNFLEGLVGALGGGLGGMKLGSMVGLPMASGIGGALGAGAGYASKPMIGKIANMMVPGTATQQALAKYLAPAYRPVARSAIGYNLNQNK